MPEIYILLTKIKFYRRRKHFFKSQNTKRAFSKGFKGKKMPAGSGLATPGLGLQKLSFEIFNSSLVINFDDLTKSFDVLAFFDAATPSSFDWSATFYKSETIYCFLAYRIQSRHALKQFDDLKHHLCLK
jgi:hypothetical protein